MSANEYNKRRYEAGDFTDAHITELTKYWQRGHGLAVDGYLGPNTVASINKEAGFTKSRRVYPLVQMPDGRRPIITSGFYTENPSRPKHNGVDFFYRWLDSDPAVPVGDGGAIKRNGKRRWWYPPEGCFPQASEAITAMDGKVTVAGKIGTGFRCYVDHGNGYRTAYFHLAQLFVSENQVVGCGMSLGLVGDSPKGHDGKHLHFEVHPHDRYAPINPRTWLENASYTVATENKG